MLVSAFSLLTLLPHSSFLSIILSPSKISNFFSCWPCSPLRTLQCSSLHRRRCQPRVAAWSCTQADELAGRHRRLEGAHCRCHSQEFSCQANKLLLGVFKLKLVRVCDLAKICYPGDSERRFLDTKNAFPMKPGKSNSSKPRYCKILNQANIIAML